MNKAIPTFLIMIPVWLCFYFLPGCGQGENTLLEVDPGAAPLVPSFQTVRNILDRSCVPCHKGGDAQDQLEQPDLTTCDTILDARLLIQRAVNDETMPPGAWPRLSDREKLIIDRWIQNRSCAPCNPLCPDGGTP